MTLEEHLVRYKDRDPRVKEYMGFCIQALLDKYGFISPEFIISLDLLADNLTVMFTALDDMKDKGTVVNKDKYRGDTKSPALQTYFNAQTYVHKLIGSFGFTPSSKSKIKENTEEHDLNKVLDAIRNVE